MSDPAPDVPDSEKSAGELDDVKDREELRNRYGILLQELRVILPGVQILLAFLFTIPFSQRFEDLDSLGRGLFAVSLTSAMVSVLFLLAPTPLHRFGTRTARSDRLQWSIRFLKVGVLVLALALFSGLWGVARFVFGSGVAWWLLAPALATFVAAWIGVPLTLHSARRPPDRS